MALSRRNTFGRSGFLLALALLAFVAAPKAQLPLRLTPASINVEKLQSQQAAVLAREDLDSPTKGKIESTYKRAIDELNRASRFRSEIEALRRAMTSAPGEIAQLERSLEAQQLRGARPDPLPPAETLGTEAVAQRVTEARLARDEARLEVDSLARLTSGSDRQALEALRSRDEAQANLVRLQAERSGAVVAETPLAEAISALRSARIEAMRAEFEWLDREAAYQPASAQITQLKLEIARLDLARKDAALRAWIDVLTARHQLDVETARARAARAEAELGKAAAVVPRLVAGNAELRAQLAETTAELDRARRELSQLRSSRADLDAYRRSVEQSVDQTTLSDESAEELIRRLGALPTPERFSAARTARTAQMQTTIDSNRNVQGEIERLADLSGAAAAALAAGADIGEQDRSTLRADVVAELGKRRALLLRISEQQKSLIQTLRQSGNAEDDLIARAGAARGELLGQLLWVPLKPIGLATFSGLKESVDWVLSPTNWRQVYDALAEQVERWPLRVMLALLAIVALYAQRGRWKRRLAALAPAAVSVEHYRIGHTLQALLLTLLLAAPGALVLNLIGAGLTYAPAASQFARASGDAFAYTGFTFLAMYGFSWLFDARGVAVRHFQWPAEAMVALQRAIRRFMLIYVPLVFVAVANGPHAPFVNRESLGRLAFILAMLSLAGFVWFLFRSASPISRQLMPEGSSGWAVRLRPLWLALALFIPLGLAVLSAAGYFPAAIALFELVKRTLLVVLAAVIVYGLVALWVLVQRARLARRQAASTEPDGHEEHVADEGSQPAPTMQLDITAIGEQSRKLLNLLATAVLFGGLWLIWRNALPLFDVFGELALWRYTETIDGEQVTGAVTIGTLALAVVILIVSGIATRNVGAVLDIVLLQRLELRKDATYAIKTVSRYVIMGIGLVLASNTLHIGWDRLQWLVAALGVGLGFGLQEIVANFVSGLIVLGERPIRIGDVVTVGDLTGTVTRIRARATVVTDWDNKEIMIPNKAFITERVINWTLSSHTTRLLIKVGVAYGSDTVSARRVILEAVTAIPEVLKEPSPSVYFVGFGDSSLDFEIRAFVGAFDKRLPTVHAIHAAVERGLREHGIEIPFPQRDLHIRSAPGLSATAPKLPGTGEDPA
jgi:potassium efflux system protein